MPPLIFLTYARCTDTNLSEMGKKTVVYVCRYTFKYPPYLKVMVEVSAAVQESAVKKARVCCNSYLVD